MLFKSQILQQASGSMGGSTFARGKSGPYVRQRGSSIQRNSPAQQWSKSALAFLVNEWTLTLTDSQRQGWATYARNVPMLNPLGDMRQRTGQQMFLRYNISAMATAQPSQTYNQAGIIPTRYDAPTTFNLGVVHARNIHRHHRKPLPVQHPIHVHRSVGHVGVRLHGNLCQSAPERFNHLLQRALATTGCAGPYDYTSPMQIPDPWGYVPGQRAFIRVITLSGDGRLSADQICTVVAT